MIVYNFSSQDNYSRNNRKAKNTSLNSKIKRNSFSLIRFLDNTSINILGNQSGFVFQIIGVLIITVAVFMAVQGIFSSTIVSTKAQAKAYSANIVTNFQTTVASKDVANNINNTKLIDIP